MQYSITFELHSNLENASQNRLTHSIATVLNSSKLRVAARRLSALAQESHENIVDRHRLFILALADSEQENEMSGFVAPAMPCGAITV